MRTYQYLGISLYHFNDMQFYIFSCTTDYSKVYAIINSYWLKILIHCIILKNDRKNAIIVHHIINYRILAIW